MAALVQNSLPASPPPLTIVEAGRPSTFYYPQLDGMRMLAFLMVFGSHAGGFTEGSFPPVIKELAWTYNSFVRVGWSGVDLFFVLSAFLITSLLLREEQSFQSVSVSKFLLRRVLRIWPMYFLIVIFGLLTFPFVTEPVFAQFGSHTFYRYIFNNLIWFSTFTMNLGMSNLMACPPANLTPLWSISLEEQFYLFWGFFIKGVKGFPTRLALLSLMLVGTIFFRWNLMQHSENSHVPFYVNTFSRLDPLIFGTILAFAIRYSPGFLTRVQKFSPALFAASVCIFAWATTHGSTFITKHVPLALTAFDFGWMLFVLSVLTYKPLVQLFSNTYVASFGRLTYGMYLIHAMVIQAITTHLVKALGYSQSSNESVALVLCIGLPATFVLAWLLWHAYEKHFYNLKYKISPLKSGYSAATL